MAENTRARFFETEDEPKRTLVEISVIGDDKETSIQKVTPEHITKFHREWAAFEKKLDVVDYGGTPLTDIPGVVGSVAAAYRARGVHNAEQLAELSDGNAMSLGAGAITARKAAQNLIAANEATALKAVIAGKAA